MLVHLENVRTFAGSHTAELAPITLLIGENSAGKSSFLGMIGAMFDSDQFPFSPNFDQPPYSLGSFDTIATFKGGRYGRAKQFGIGFEKKPSGQNKGHRVYARYCSDRGRVALLDFEIKQGDRSVFVTITSRGSQGQTAHLLFDSGTQRHEFDLNLPNTYGDPSHLNLSNILLSALFRDSPLLRNNIELTHEFLDILHCPAPYAAISVAPIRTRPERTYSQAKQGFDPTGDHIPFVLDRLLTGSSNKKESRDLTASLELFGKESGLFDKVSIKKLGGKATDPFQVNIGLAGRARNLIDVGYGVSQALPVVVQTVLENPNRLILMQQPEVHLHPRAQAALGSFFARMAHQSGRRMVIETHSDFIVDRLRQEVANNRLPASFVRILYFNRSGYETNIHTINLDRSGNIVGAPPCYREFFLEEEIRLLSRAGD